MPRHFPCWLTAYVDLFDGRTEAPSSLHYWTGVSTVAGALTRRVWIDERVFRYYPNQYIVFVAPPGISTKSTAINLGMGMLRQLDHIHMAPDNTNYPTLARDMARHATEIRDQIADNPADDLWVRQCAVTCAISEFGTFLKVEDEDMLNALTDWWDCRTLHIKDTKFNGTDTIEHPFLNLIAGTTPDWVRKKLQAVGGWGLSSRIIFIYTDKKARRIPRPSKLWIPGELESEQQRLVEDLRQIADLEGPMQFSDGADALVCVWYEQLQDQIEAHNAGDNPDPWTGYFLARKQAHVHKLAMILSACRRSDLVVGEEDVQEAITVVDAVEQEISKVFEHIPEPSPLARLEQEALARIIAELTRSPQGRISRAAAYSRVANLVDSSTASHIIDNAIGRGVWNQVVAGGQAWLKLPQP